MEDRYLFRGKRIDNGKWVVGHFYEFMGKSYIFEPPFTSKDLTYEVDPSTICQCTGLKDKNGKLIWENDIVEVAEHEDAVNGLYGVIYCKRSHCYALERSIDFHYNFFTFSDLNGFETSSNVIGNKFDNTELLESED